MKKKLVTTALLGVMLAAQADEYNYLSVEKTDGTVISLSASDLTITFTDGYLMAGNLSKMYFSNTGATGINSIIDDENISIGDADAIYDLNGRQLPQGAQLHKGVYIVKKNGRTLKVQVR